MSDRLEELYRGVLEEIGEDPEREGLQKTPTRAARAIQFMTEGYRQTLDKIINGAVYHEDVEDIVVVRDIEFFSLCEHHILPFFGYAHVAYLPNGKILGISKVARIVDMFARRLQVQERMTQQIALAVQEALEPVGVACVVEAKHLCMMARGVEKQASNVSTSYLTGIFRDSATTRKEFFDLIQGRKTYA
ncbi:MAG: GTP cyclohydrolase I FolE [Armatimonadetes bacterium]|nr:GTP cyclohydrolase I FolE [Armatimonadota bacterium]